jgi:hypothetical protein
VATLPRRIAPCATRRPLVSLLDRTFDAHVRQACLHRLALMIVLFLLRTELTSNLINAQPLCYFAPDGTYQQSDLYDEMHNQCSGRKIRLLVRSVRSKNSTVVVHFIINQFGAAGE